MGALQYEGHLRRRRRGGEILFCLILVTVCFLSVFQGEGVTEIEFGF